MPDKATPPSHQREYAREYRRKRYEITGNKFIKDWRSRHPDLKREYNDRWNANHPEKRKAHDAVWAAIHAGRVKPAREYRCVDCGEPAQEYDHYLGYAPEHRLSIHPVCRKCHGKRRRIPEVRI